MSNLSINDFTHLVIVRSSKETSNALADPKVREKDRRDIQSQVDEYLRSGGSINVVDPAHGTGRHQVSKLTNPESDVVTIAVKNLRANFGDDLDIKQDMESGKYIATYKGRKLGKMKTSLTKAKAAIRCEGLRDNNNSKKGKTDEVIERFKKRETDSAPRRTKTVKQLIHWVEHGSN